MSPRARTGNDDWALPTPEPAPQPTKERPLAARMAIALVAPVVLIGGIIGAAFYWSGQQEKAGCEEAVIERAKYPSAAEILEIEKTDYVPMYADATHGYKGTADFVNAYGVPERVSFTCTVFDDGTPIMALVN